MSRISLSITLFLTLAIVQAQRVGLVLSGGGAVGMTHIGVMQALEENDRLPRQCILTILFI